MYCDLVLYQALESFVVSRLDSYVVSNLVLCCIKTVYLYCIKSILLFYQVNDSHRWYPMRMDLQLWIWTCVVSSHVIILCDILLVVVTQYYKSPLGINYP